MQIDRSTPPLEGVKRGEHRRASLTSVVCSMQQEESASKKRKASDIVACTECRTRKVRDSCSTRKVIVHLPDLDRLENRQSAIGSFHAILAQNEGRHGSAHQRSESTHHPYQVSVILSKLYRSEWTASRNCSLDNNSSHLGTTQTDLKKMGQATTCPRQQME